MKIKLNKIILGIVLLMILTLIYYFISATFESSPIWYTNQPFPVAENKIYKPKDVIRFVISRCASKKTIYLLGQAFIPEFNNDINKYYLTSAQPESTVGCTKVLGIPVVILEEMPTGWYHKEMTISVKGNYRDFVFLIESERFYVKNDHPTIIDAMSQTLPIK